MRYGVELATRYLREAEEAFERRDYRGVVASSQLCAENAAKAVIAPYRIPSWSHDPSHELLEVIQHLRPELRGLAEELAEITRKLAPEHGRATYGEPTRGLTPWDIYGEGDALEALSMARRAWELMKAVLKELKVVGNGQEGVGANPIYREAIREGVALRLGCALDEDEKATRRASDRSLEWCVSIIFGVVSHLIR